MRQKTPRPAEQDRMKNVTVAISDIAHLKARVWAAEHETSLSAVVAYLLETLPKNSRANAHYPQRAETPQPSSEGRSNDH